MWIDVAMGLVLALGALRGFRVGFAKPMVHLTGLVAGLLAAEPLSHWVAEHAGERLAFLPAAIRPAALFFACLVAMYAVLTLVGCSYLRWYRTQFLGENKPSFGDRFVGIGLGLVKGAIVIYIAAFGASRFVPALLHHESVREMIAASKGVPLLRRHQPIEWVLRTEHAQRVARHLGTLIDQFRSPGSESSATPETASQEASPLR